MTFEQVYDEHFDFVWRTLRRLGVRDDDAKDAVQDVFLVVHRALAGFEGRSKLTTWLFGICFKVAAARRRSGYVRRERVTDPSTLEQPDPRPDAASELERSQALDLVHTLIDDLPEEQRIVFVLFELESLGGEEIAELTGASVGTVRSRLRLAREGFRQALLRTQARDRFERVSMGGSR